ncbi:hypothetical protein AAH178_002907 [Serratia marcescens]
MRYDILMKVKSVKQVGEVSLTDAECGDVVITFECETPLNEWDTCAMMNISKKLIVIVLHQPRHQG